MLFASGPGVGGSKSSFSVRRDASEGEDRGRSGINSRLRSNGQRQFEITGALAVVNVGNA